MNNYPFDTAGLCTEEIDRFQEAYTTLKSKFHIEFTGQIDFHLEQFEVFKNHTDVNVRNSYVIKHENNDSYMLFIENKPKKHIRQKIAPEREYQIWALAYLKHDFGRVLIRPETLADKIIELIHPVELDFDEDKAFSDTFYVLIDDREKAIAGMNRHFRNVVMDIREDDFIVEIVEHTLIIGAHKPTTVEKAVYMAEFIARLCTTCE